jgi:hypothetical protein
MKKQVAAGALLASMAVLSASRIEADGAGPNAPAAKVVWQLVGRTLLNPATGAGQVLGYFTFIQGVPDPMFSGAPNESTAHFTLRSQPFNVQLFPNGDILIGLLGDETFALYLDETPDQDFNNPATFSDGQELANFNRLPAQINFVGPVFTDTFSAEFLSSSTFFWQDRRISLRRVTPRGVTLSITGSTAFQPTTVPEFPVSVSFGAAAVAIGHGSNR